uniref:AB hydrolase-1 domain-containing protein n=1 Tax=Tetradesmus obliquus TaxID=3088 RepID=A0A383VJB4_TETOB|eukprot:jgi/Sobl393_1/2372/SZX64754.1
MQAAPRHAAGPSRQRHSSAAHSGSRIRHIAYIAAPTTLADTQTAWAPAVSEQRQQPALLPRAADPAEQQGPLQQQWNWRWGSSITYTQAGCAIDGRPALLLLHGFGVSHKHFVHNIEVLAEQYTVYAVDLLGHGGSWPSQHVCEASGQQLHYNVATYTEQLHSFIQERVGQPVYVAGNSLGGFLAANLAAHHPDAVRGVVLLNAAPFTSPYIPGRDLLLWRLLAAAADDALPAPREQIASFVRDFWWDIIRQPDSIRLVLQLVYARHSAIDDQLVDCILEPTQHPQALDAFVSMVLSPAGKLSFEQVLQRVECPVCLAYAVKYIVDQLLWCILEPTQHPQALDAFVSMVLSPAGKQALSFEQVLQRVECPVCLAYAVIHIVNQLMQCILEPTQHPQALDAFVSMVLSPAGKLSFEQVLQRVECPVCLAYGREDPWVAPLYGHRAKRLLPAAVYLELSPAGHCPHHEAPTAVNSIIATFVAAVEAGQHQQHAALQAGTVTSFEEEDGCTVQVACVDGSPRNFLEAADAALWRLKQRAARLLKQRQGLQFTLLQEALHMDGWM